MIYRRFGKTDLMLSACGAGTTRFPPDVLKDEAGIKHCANILAYAISQGYNYIDHAFTYAKGFSEKICAELLKQVPRESFYLSVKSNAQSDQTSASVLKRIEDGLNNIRTEYFDFLYMWSILDEKQFDLIMKPGGPYEGALEAKKRGWIKHILFSNHAEPKTAEKIMKSGAFDGVLLSYNILNYQTMDPLLRCAEEMSMGVLIMNPLGGGMIPQNENMFSSIRQPTDNSVSEAALRFIYAHPQVTCVLTGLSRKEDVDQGVCALGTDTWMKELQKRIESVKKEISQISGLCTGCSYCLCECPNKIDIPQFMQSYNMKLFDLPSELYGQTEPLKRERISVLKKLIQGYRYFPDKPEIPCVNCRKCMNVCTQHLPIPTRLAEISNMLKTAGAYREAHKIRLDNLLNHKHYKKVGFWPASAYTAAVIQEYYSYFGPPQFDLAFFDSSESVQGTHLLGIPVFGKEYLERRHVDCILITSYRYQKEIYNSLLECGYAGVDLLCLHETNDVPWVF